MTGLIAGSLSFKYLGAPLATRTLSIAQLAFVGKKLLQELTVGLLDCCLCRYIVVDQISSIWRTIVLGSDFSDP